jgi:hypothetical protein
MSNKRPYPPKYLTESFYSEFAPSPELAEFVQNIFFDEKSKFYNDDHSHLITANIGFLWTNIRNERQMKHIAATAQIPNIQTSKWNKEIFNYQLATWFGREKDEELHFLITIDGNYAENCNDVSFMATLDHELYHCAQKLDMFGFPAFHRETGLPLYAIRDHDVTEFIGVTRRWGAGASLNVQELVEVGSRKPQFTASDISLFCGNCMGLRA